jgi:hypothetical protein
MSAEPTPVSHVDDKTKEPGTVNPSEVKQGVVCCAGPPSLQCGWHVCSAVTAAVLASVACPYPQNLLLRNLTL